MLPVALAACGSASGSSGNGGGKALTVGLIMLQGDQYFQGIQTGLNAAVKAEGGTVVPANSNNDAGTEASAAQNMVQRQVNAVLLQPVSSTGSLATMKSFQETFHDEGQTDLVECMRAYAGVGYAGPMRPDQVPTMHGESNDRPAYGTLGRLFALGYIRGLQHAAYGKPNLGPIPSEHS